MIGSKFERLTSLTFDSVLCHSLFVVVTIASPLTRYCFLNILIGQMCQNPKQIPRKDENVSRLESELQESRKELTILKGILVKVSEERDLMWEEVKQYNEKNMVLNSEITALKKRIEGLEEDIHLKEGQITILKDTLSNHKSFDLLGSPTSMPEFLLE